VMTSPGSIYIGVNAIERKNGSWSEEIFEVPA
jgi:hypothetical protein